MQQGLGETRTAWDCKSGSDGEDIGIRELRLLDSSCVGYPYKTLQKGKVGAPGNKSPQQPPDEETPPDEGEISNLQISEESLL